jgi:hypothetical protein
MESALFSQAVSASASGQGVSPSATVPADTGANAAEPATSPSTPSEGEIEPPDNLDEPQEGEQPVEELAAGTEAVEEALGDTSQVAEDAIKAGTYKPDATALQAKIADLMKRFPGVGKEHEAAIKKMANQDLYIAHLQDSSKGAEESTAGADGLTEYERYLGLGQQNDPQKPIEKQEQRRQQPLQSAAPPTLYEQAFGKDYQSLEQELAMERELADKFGKGEASYSDVRTVQAQRIRKQIYADPLTRGVLNKVIAEELEQAGISPDALREFSVNAFQTKDWNFAVNQLAQTKGFEDLGELGKITSPELIKLPDGRQVPDSPLNRLMRDNWEDVKDLNVQGDDARQTAIRTNLRRLRYLHKVHKQQRANAKMTTSAVQTGVDAGKNAASAQAKARLNGGGKPATTGAKPGFGGQTDEPYSARFLRDKGTKFSSL